MSHTCNRIAVRVMAWLVPRLGFFGGMRAIRSAAMFAMHKGLIEMDTSSLAAIGRRPPEAPRRVATGYVPRSVLFHRVYNLVIGLALFVMILPLFAMISLALLATQGREVFYAGPRIGRNGTLFNILKFRSLDSARAAILTSGGVLPDGSGTETPLGGFLRATRLDELPQLINVLRGDMNLVGPRPVRPEIAAICAAEIPNYNARFRVKPGLLGHTQAFMSHGTSKQIRARYNAMVCGEPVRYLNEIGLIAVVGLCVLVRSVSQTASVLHDRVFGTDADPVLPVRVAFEAETGETRAVSRFGKQTITLCDPTDGMRSTGAQGCLVITLPDRQIRRARVALTPQGARRGAGGDAASFQYTPLTDFADHIVSRYVLGQVVVPQKSLMLPEWLGRAFFRGFSSADMPRTVFAQDARPAPPASADIARENFSPRSAQI